MSILINDLSEHQDAVDWAAHRAGRQAVILRAHNGNRADTRFAANRSAAQPMRLVGLYQYLVTDRDAAVQAWEFVATVKALAPNEWPILDIEEGTDYARRAAAWLAVVEPALGRRAWVYAGDNIWRTTDLAAACGMNRCRWVARYSTTEPVMPYTLWQRSSTARAPGVRGNVDESVYPGTLEQLVALTTGDTDDMEPSELGPAYLKALAPPAYVKPRDLWHAERAVSAEGTKDALSSAAGRQVIRQEVTAAVAPLVAQFAAMAAMIEQAGGITAVQAKQIAEDAAAKALDGVTVTVHADQEPTA